MTGGRQGATGLLPKRAQHADGCAAARRRLDCCIVAQDVRPHRHRLPMGQVTGHSTMCFAPCLQPHPANFCYFPRRRLCNIPSEHMRQMLACTRQTPALLLLGRLDLLNSMPPWMGGGEMIQDVFLDHSTCVHVIGRIASDQRLWCHHHPPAAAVSAVETRSRRMFSGTRSRRCALRRARPPSRRPSGWAPRATTCPASAWGVCRTQSSSWAGTCTSR
jgi:hypothetical protein